LDLGHLYFDIVSDLELRISDFASLGIFTLVKSPLQITPFMQNKANFLDALMNVNPYNTTYYENKWQRRVRKNKPNSNPIKPNLRKAKMNVNSLITKDYRKKDDFAVQKNKPNSKPISVKPKMNVNLYVTKDYENKTVFRLEQNKPKQSQFQTRSEFIPKGAEIPTGELLGILKPGTNFKSEGRSEKWNFSHRSSDLYYRIMRKSRAQIYNELLVLKCQQGSRDAFEGLVERWQKRLWHYAFQVTGSDAAAWDVVQETWVGIINGIRKLGDAAVFGCWAFRILNNKCADWLRKQHLQSRLSDQLANQAQDESDKRQNSSEKVESLFVAIEKLSPEHRALLTLRYREGFDISQMAEILGIAEGTVKSRLHRTLEKLRQLMGQKPNG